MRAALRNIKASAHRMIGRVNSLGGSSARAVGLGRVSLGLAASADLDCVREEGKSLCQRSRRVIDAGGVEPWHAKPSIAKRTLAEICRGTRDLLWRGQQRTRGRDAAPAMGQESCRIYISLIWLAACPRIHALGALRTSRVTILSRGGVSTLAASRPTEQARGEPDWQHLTELESDLPIYPSADPSQLALVPPVCN